jgi:mannose/cellobiose epimerase-like protein (N-acyl-D-glucosamine 2-epimerase family)
MTRTELGTAIGAAAFLAVAAWNRIREWRPRAQHISAQTLDELARRHDTAGLNEFNAKDPHPFAVERMRVLPGGRR